MSINDLSAEELALVKELLVQPVRDAMDERNRAIVGLLGQLSKRIETLETKVGVLEGYKRRVVAIASGAGILVGAAWELGKGWLVSKFGGGNDGGGK